jgi:hypothetical protein
MRLGDLQRELQQDLLGEPSAIAGAIVDAPPLPVEGRLGIYRNAYRSRLVEALDDTYPVLHKILGDDMFEEAGHRFVMAHPSRHRSIRWYGSELADFLAHSAPFDAQPILAEVARFEWTLSEVFDSADATPLDRAAIMAVDPNDWATLTFRFHPSLRRLQLAWNSVAAWKAISADSDPPAPQRSAEPVQWLLWRQALENYFRSIDAAESAALDAAVRGETFETICAALSGCLPEEEVPMRVASLVGTWTDGGLIIGAGPTPGA